MVTGTTMLDDVPAGKEVTFENFAQASSAVVGRVVAGSFTMDVLYRPCMVKFSRVNSNCMLLVTVKFKAKSTSKPG